MTVEEYRKAPALNFSMAKLLLDSPAHFKAGEDEEKEETDAMRVGSIAHALILEGKSFSDLYAIKPKGMTFASNEGKLWKAQQTLPILKEDDANAIPRMAEAIAANPDAANLFRCLPHRETPVFGNLMGVECKCLIDLHGEEWGDPSIGDLKTAADASPREFGRVVANRHYDLQHAWYSSLFSVVNNLEKPPLWTWIVVEKKAPFFNLIYTPEEFVESGMEKLEKVLTLYKRCLEEDRWPFALTGIHKLPKPAWA
jgi:hypothetical protein